VAWKKTQIFSPGSKIFMPQNPNKEIVCPMTNILPVMQQAHQVYHWIALDVAHLLPLNSNMQ
jgi:hypothetical protein